MSAPAPAPVSASASTPAPTSSSSTSKPSKPEKPSKDAAAPPPAAGDTKLTAKQLKELKKAEKQARRAADKASAGLPVSTGKPDASKPKSGSDDKKSGGGGGGKAQQGGKSQQQHQQKGGQKGESKDGGHSVKAEKAEKAVDKSKEKEIALFRHLENPETKVTVASAHKDVHPAILALGLQMAEYVIVGSSARVVATLLAFKRVIEDYTTPPGTTLPRHLSSHHISPQIEHLRSARPMSVSMRNAIRWLKLEISTVSIDLPEDQAKSLLLEKIDNYIREKITVADTVIADTAADKIVDGDVIAVYAKSSIVQQVLAEAYRRGTRFRVIVIDSRPLFEGVKMAKALAEMGVECTYTLLHALSYVVRTCTKVFLGAHSMLSNGRLYSRVGTAALAMYAKEFEVPVIVCCESIKFTDKVGLDSIVNNELAEPDQLVNTSVNPEMPIKGRLAGWRGVAGLKLLNVLYDVTPAEYITAVITEYGSLPASSVPVVHRISTGQ